MSRFKKQILKNSTSEYPIPILEPVLLLQLLLSCMHEPLENSIYCLRTAVPGIFVPGTNVILLHQVPGTELLHLQVRTRYLVLVSATWCISYLVHTAVWQSKAIDQRCPLRTARGLSRPSWRLSHASFGSVHADGQVAAGVATVDIGLDPTTVVINTPNGPAS